MRDAPNACPSFLGMTSIQNHMQTTNTTTGDGRGRWSRRFGGVVLNAKFC